MRSFVLVIVAPNIDPFAMLQIKEEPQPVELSFVSTDSREPDAEHDGSFIIHPEETNSILPREFSPRISLERAASPLSPPRKIPELGHRPSIEFDLDSPPPPGRLGSYQSDSLTRAGSPLGPRYGSPGLGISSRSGSPLQFSTSLHNGLVKSTSNTSLRSTSGSPNGRSPRISREDVQRRLAKKRSVDSPLREVVDSNYFSSQADKGEDTEDEDMGRPLSPKPRMAPALARQNPTYDGVMSIDPEPQPIDPPRPSIPTRSLSTDGIPSEPSLSTQGFTGLTLDFQSDENGRMSFGEVPIGDMRSALDRLMEDVAGGASVSTGPDGKSVVRGLKVEAVTTGVQAGQFQLPTEAAEPTDRDSIMDESEDENSMDCDEPNERLPISATESEPPHIDHNPISNPQFAASAPDLSFTQESVSPPAPAPPPKDARRQREELILQKKREARRREEEEDMGMRTPPRSLVRPGGRGRSRSTSELNGAFGGGVPSGKRVAKDGTLLDVPMKEEDPLSDSIDRELRKLGAVAGNVSALNGNRSGIKANSTHLSRNTIFDNIARRFMHPQTRIVLLV